MVRWEERVGGRKEGRRGRRKREGGGVDTRSNLEAEKEPVKTSFLPVIFVSIFSWGTGVGAGEVGDDDGRSACVLTSTTFLLESFTPMMS